MRAMVVARAAVLILAGCGGSEGDSEVPARTGSAPTAEASEDAGPVAPASVKSMRPEDVNSAEGAEAYSIFVMQTIVYTISTNDPEPLLALSDGDSCTSCNSLARVSIDSGDVVQIPHEDIPIADIEVEQRDETSYVVRQVLQAPEVTYTDVSTEEVTETEAPEDLKVTSVVKWKDGTWVLDNYGTTER